jgi:Ca-activated chloride channel homolog
VPDASRISPPRIDALHPDAALISLRGKMDARFVEMSSVTSATHPVIVRDETESLLVTIPPSGNVPDRDFVLRWNERVVEALDLRSISCVDEEARYAVVRLDAPADAPVAGQRSRDYYFLVDRSGSMAGKKWSCTAQALNAFVDELGDADQAWVTLFESGFQDFAEAPLAVAELKKDPAFRQLEKLGAQGGTELLPAFQHVIEKISAHSKGRDPVIIIITDGQVGNEAAVTKMLRDHRGLVVHTFGIDTAVNDAFLKQVAGQHRGACVLMTPNDDIQGAVRQLGNRLRRPVLTGLTIPEGWEATCAYLPDVHAGEHILVALKGPKEAREIALTGRLADETAHTFRFDLKSGALASPRLLWARQAMDRCLAEERGKEAIELAIRHNVICQGAAFIAYDVKEKVAIAKEDIYQPSMEPARVDAMVYRGPVAGAAPMAGMANMRERSVGISSPAPAAKASSLADLINRAKQGLLAVTTPPTRGHESATEKRLREIDERHRRGSKQPNIRTELLVKEWRAKTEALPFFQTEIGQLLRELLCRWAMTDPVARFPLLTGLAEGISVSDPRQRVQAFVRKNIVEASLARDLLWLVEQVA